MTRRILTLAPAFLVCAMAILYAAWPLHFDRLFRRLEETAPDEP